MKCTWYVGGLWVVLIVMMVGTSQPTFARPSGTDTPIRIGLSSQLFDDQARNQILDQMKPFTEKVQKQVGTPSEFVIVDDLKSMARQLNDKSLQMAVMSGLDYGWIKPLCPDIRALLTTSIEGGVLKTVLLVKKDATWQSNQQLKRQSLAMPQRTPNYVKFFLEQETKQTMSAYYQLLECRNVDEAIEAVIDGKAAATAVSASAMDVFKERKPGRFNRLKVLMESDAFPAPVVVYQAKNTNEKQIEKFAEALLRADDSTEGKQMLTLWRLRGFVKLPADFETHVDRIVKKYPSTLKP